MVCKILRRHETACNSDSDSSNKTSTVHKWPKPFCPRLLGPTFCWKTFYRQSDAFEFAKQFSEDVYIFAFESATDPTLNKGQRKYLATSLPVFWHYYSQLSDGKKAHYEIIPEGSACKLYFDLEFQEEYNPSSQGKRMTDIFIKYVCSWISVSFGFEIDRRNVLDLDSSTAHKFSRHLIFILPRALFDNNVTVGRFVHYIMAALIHHVEKHSSMSLDVSAAAATSSTSSCTAQNAHPSHMMNHSTPPNTDSTVCLSSSGAETYHRDQACSFTYPGSSSVNFDDFFSGKDDDLCLLGDSFSNESNECDVFVTTRVQTASSESSYSDLACHSYQEYDNANSCVMNENVSPVHSDTHLSEDSDDKDKLLAPSLEKDTPEVHKENAKKVLSLFSMEDLQTLFIRKKDGSFTPFCDLGVYTRNRNFRIYLSSKLNKNNPLVLAKENSFKPESEYESYACDIFYASLVSHISILKDTHILTFDNEGIGRTVKSRTERSTPKETPDAAVKSETLEGWNSSSPYPEVDEFVTSLIASNGHSGSIRHWTYFTASETLVYDIIGYRWCGNVVRQHKSNNIMYVTDLRQGVYYQKCYDPECQAIQYRSPEMPLPPHVLPGFYFDFEDGNTFEDNILHAGETEDEQLVTAVEDAELLQELNCMASSDTNVKIEI